MRRLTTLAMCFSLAGALFAAAPASAKPTIKIKTTYYDITGDTGLKLLVAMNRRGPKHGWWSRSIAQTQYTTSWGASWQWKNGQCRATKAPVDLSITYVYPRLKGKQSRVLRARWKTFLRKVVIHEEVHGKLARQMASAVEKAVLSTRVKTSDKRCRSMKGQLTRNVNKVLKTYEAKQVAFDKVEHRNGGNVDRMVKRLVGDNKKTASTRNRANEKKAAARRAITVPTNPGDMSR